MKSFSLSQAKTACASLFDIALYFVGAGAVGGPAAHRPSTLEVECHHRQSRKQTRHMTMVDLKFFPPPLPLLPLPRPLDLRNLDHREFFLF